MLGRTAPAAAKTATSSSRRASVEPRTTTAVAPKSKNVQRASAACDWPSEPCLISMGCRAAKVAASSGRETPFGSSRNWRQAQ